MKESFTVIISNTNYEKLYKHLFPGDDNEHGAVLAVGVSKSSFGTKLLVKEVFLATDGLDYVPGERGYRALTPKFIVEKSDYCIENNLGYLAVHCHYGENSVSFSQDDYNSHNRGYPALLQMIGQPIGALVFAKNSMAGSIWTENGIFSVDHLKIIGSKIRFLYPNAKIKDGYIFNQKYDRHALLFGEEGQAILNKLHVGIIGLGGGGSLINEWVSKLGVGEITAIDFDKIETSNLPRVVGATAWDCMKFLVDRKLNALSRIGTWLSKYKVTIAKRVAKRANPKIKYNAIIGNILDENTALKLKDCDFIFLATDNISSRNVFNAILHQYLIPGAQIGAKVRVNKESKKIIDIFSVGRIIIPEPNGGCLYCNNWIPPYRLQEELLSEKERKEQRYIEDENINEPSVITLNVLSASQVVNDFMMMFTGLYPNGTELYHIHYDLLNRETNFTSLTHDESCLHCSSHKKSVYATGDRRELPCRE